MPAPAAGFLGVSLAGAADDVARRRGLKLDYQRPTDAISQKILESLDAFADASRGRYANLAALGDPNLSNQEPIGNWWGEVAELILKQHYYRKQIQARGTIPLTKHIGERTFASSTKAHRYAEPFTEPYLS